MNKESQKKRVIDYLKTGGTLSIYNAPLMVQIYHQLARAIYYARIDLLIEGYTIDSKLISRNGNKYSQYTLREL